MEATGGMDDGGEDSRVARKKMGKIYGRLMRQKDEHNRVNMSTCPVIWTHRRHDFASFDATFNILIVLRMAYAWRGFCAVMCVTLHRGGVIPPGHRVSMM